MRTRILISGLIYAVAMVLLAVVAAWPIYASAQFLIVAFVSALVGGGIAFASRWLKPWVTAVALVGVSYLLAMSLATPEYWTAGTIWPLGLRDAALGFITGWKDLATAPLPVGEYRNLLVPVVAVFVVGTFVLVRCAFSSRRNAGFSVLAAGVMLFFGLIFGRTSVSSPLQLGPLTITAPVETGIGVAALVLSVVWLAWRARDERKQAILRAANATGIQHGSTRSGAGVARSVMAVAMVVIAVGAAGVVTPLITETRTRDVIRSAVGPEVILTSAETPLSTYRANFTDDHIDEVLFSYSTAGAVPSRIRLATLGNYDGATYQVDVTKTNPYQRVPSRLDVQGGTSSTLKIQIGALNGIWVPTFGDLQQIQFQGAQGPSLADAFYYSKSEGTGIVTTGVSAGETYVITAAVADPMALEKATPPGVTDPIQPPESLVAWLDKQKVAPTGAGLSQLLATLRERGYLSHALLPPVEGQTDKWMSKLSGYPGFQPSAAGHSLARIDDMFKQLLEQENRVAGAENVSLVAAVGDDEQFAVAAALLAEQLGFPARVVVGVHTSGEGEPVCTGDCVASDLSAWVEIQDASGTWIPADVTPQYENSIDVQSRSQRDPQNYTDVRPDDAREVAPPDPDQKGNEDPGTDKPTHDTIADVVSALRYVGMGVLALILLLAPFLTILIAKVARRRERNTADDNVEAIAGGWEEYVDAAVDAGKPAPTFETRHELAAEYGTPLGTMLAARADHAQFSNGYISDAEADEFWKIVKAERSAIKKEQGWWHRIRAALSVKSFVRQLSPAPRKTPRRTREREPRPTRKKTQQ